MHFPPQLIDGYRAFLLSRLRYEQDRYRALAEKGQSPQIMVIGCCDSRVSPEVIFDARPGELFVVRNIANIVPPYAPGGPAQGVSAALEYAVCALNVRHIVVLGHAQCGGIKAFAEEAAPLAPGDFIGRWMRLMAPAAARAGERAAQSPADYLRRLEQANVINSLANLMTFPVIAAKVGRGETTLHGAYFGVATGQLLVHDRMTDAFVQVAADDHARLVTAPHS